jgi:competence protein ComEC
MDFLQRTPFFRLLLPFIIGIVVYQFVEIVGWSLYVLVGLAAFLIFLSFVIRTPKRQFQFRWLFGFGIFIFMFSLAYFLSSEHEKVNRFDYLHKKGIYRVEITSPPVEKAKSYLCKVDVLQYFDSTWKPAHGQAILYFQKDKNTSRLLFGDCLMVEADFAPPEKPLNPDGFDYAAYLKRQGIGATSYISSGSWQFAGRDESFSIRREADKWQKYLLGIYRKFNIQGDEFAVLAALTLGYTDDLQPDIRASYSATGTVHILSVSGMHVAVIYVVIGFLLGFLDKKQGTRILKAVLIIAFLWGYAFLTGMSAAVIRAAVMLTFVVIANSLNRKSLIYNTIFMSMLAMLLYNPNFLYDVGFQLSYAAVLSIIFFQPIINKLYSPTGKLSKIIWEIFSVSIAAQLGTTPFTLYYFQQFPNYFIITNFVAIPLSSLIIYLAIGLLFVSFIPYLSVAVSFMLKWSLWFMNHFIVWIQDLPYSVSHISIDLRQSLILFLAIFCLSLYYFNRKFMPLFIGLLSVLITFLFSLHQNYKTLTSKKMIVYTGQTNMHINFVNRSKNYVFSTDSIEIERIAKAFWQNQKLERPQYLHKAGWFSDGFAYFEGHKILILYNDILKNKTTDSPLFVDYLIIGNKLKPKIEQILECVSPRKVIVDKSISNWYTNRIRKVCNEKGIQFYSTAEKGAYILNITD